MEHHVNTERVSDTPVTVATPTDTDWTAATPASTDLEESEETGNFNPRDLCGGDIEALLRQLQELSLRFRLKLSEPEFDYPSAISETGPSGSVADITPIGTDWTAVTPTSTDSEASEETGFVYMVARANGPPGSCKVPDVDAIDAIKAACEAHSDAIRRMYGMEEGDETGGGVGEEGGAFAGVEEEEDRARMEEEEEDGAGASAGVEEEEGGASAGIEEEDGNNGVEAYAPGFSKNKGETEGTVYKFEERW